MESQDSSQETQPDASEQEIYRPTRDVIAKLIPMHPTADYVDIVTVPFTFGRAKTCDFVINDKRISAMHCTFDKKDDQLYVVDNSTNGTYLNQKLLHKGNRSFLKTGDIVALVEKDGYGTFSYVFYDVCAPHPTSQDKVFKEYLVECVLGNGNFGVVQRVKRITTGELFAMKVIDKMKLMANYNKTDENNTLMEVHILKMLRHPNIISVVEVCDTPRYVYLILELADQGELFEKIFNQGCYSESEGKYVFRQILDAIAYLHDNCIAHRDLKPENILLHQNKNGESAVKVSDFGLAKMLGEFQSTRTLCGTPMYVAPEMLAHSRFLQGDKTVAPEAKNGYGIEVDAWSLGCILYIILSGRPPFNDPIPKDLFECIAAGQYEISEEPWCRISSDAKELISQLLVVDPVKRLTVRGALDHRWFDEYRHLPLFCNVGRPNANTTTTTNTTSTTTKSTKHNKSETSDKPETSGKSEKSDKPEKLDKFEKSDEKLDNFDKSDKPDKLYKSDKYKKSDKPDNYAYTQERVLERRDKHDTSDITKNRNNESFRMGSKPQNKQNSPIRENLQNNTNRENIENRRHSGERILSDTARDTSDVERESSKRTDSNTKNGSLGSDTEQALITKVDRHSPNKDGVVAKAMDRHSVSSKRARPDSRTERFRSESRTTDKSGSGTPRPRPNEIEPMTTSSKEGAKETKSAHAIFALPSTPSTKSSPHHSPKKSASRFLGSTRAQLTFVTPEKSTNTEAKTSTLKDSPVLSIIDKTKAQSSHNSSSSPSSHSSSSSHSRSRSSSSHSSHSSHSSKAFQYHQPRKQLDFAKLGSRMGSVLSDRLTSGLGNNGGDDKKRKQLPNLARGEIIIEDDETDSSRIGKKHKEL